VNRSQFGKQLCQLIGIAVAVLANSNTVRAIHIETVFVGDPGNAADVDHATLDRPYGAVDYAYRIGKFEVTNNQYAEFLNAVAQADTKNLYSSYYDQSGRGGIDRHGSFGSYSYSVVDGMGDIPVVYVSFLDAIRFTNWLHNGQTAGPQNASTTEDGAYTITPQLESSGAIFRNPDAKWFIPSDDEWYKAAFYDPSKPGGPGYWKYATRADTLPYSDAPGDTDAPDPSNLANYYNNDNIDNGFNDGFAITGSTAFDPFDSVIYANDVGAYAIATAYGTLDQAGNVLEWTEGFYVGTPGPVIRSQRGGAWNIGAFGLASDYANGEGLNVNHMDFAGFRVAAAVPEPSTIVSALGAVWIALLNKGRIRRA
jgi:formylglycine-generating enzyme required for sulfatase activity